MNKMKRVWSLFSVITVMFVFLSCDISYNEPVKEYFEYWAKSVTVGRYDIASETTVLDGRKNISAVDPIKINIILTNPKNYEIELGNDDGAYFVIYQNNDEAKTEIASSKSAELSPDKTIITLSANLPNNTERKDLMIEGYFIYYKESEPFEIPYSYSFKQLSAPDNPKNLKNPENPDSNGYHCLHFEMPNTGLIRNKDLTYRIDCYSRTTSEDFEFLATADLKAEQTKSTGKANEFIYYFDQQEPSLQYEYVVTAISPEGVKSKTVSTSDALGLCYVTEPEIIFASNGSLNNLTAEKEGESETYNVVEYTGDSFSVNVVKTDSTSELNVKVNGQTVDADTVLEDGFNKITATASKNRARPVTVTKNIYVTKKLVEPKITTNASLNGTTASNSINYDVLQYSYLAYDNCTYSIDNSANKDSQITFKLDNSTTTELSGTLADGKHSLEIIVSKDYCNPITVKKNYSVGIKQINLCVGEIKMKHEGDDKEDAVELDGTIYAKTTRSSKIEKKFNSSALKKEHSYTFSSNLILKEKTDKFYFWTTEMIDHDGWGAKDKLGEIKENDSEMTRTLKDLKNNRYFHKKQQGESGKYYSEYTFTVTLSEYALPLLTFTPDLSGLSNGGYECIEVADSNSKANYSITSQETGTTIYGAIDDEEFTGEKTGELAVGKHKIKIVSTKSGSTPYITYRYINVLTTFAEPNIYFYANNTPNRIDTTESDSPVSSYTTYDLALTTSGTGNATLEVAAGSGETVTVEDGKNTLTAKNGRYELALGPHSLSIIVSKTGYLPKIINKDIYIQGTLSYPDIVTIHDEDTSSGSGNSEADPRIINYSYIANETLKCRVKPGNDGNTVVVYENQENGNVIKNATSSFDAGYGTVKKLVIVQTRQHCKTLTKTKYVKGLIKPVTLSFNNNSGTGKLEVWLDGFKNTTFNLKGNINVNNNCMYNYEKSKYEVTQRQWQTLNDTTKYNFTIICYTPSDNIKLTVDRIRRDVGSGADEPQDGFGGWCTRTLSDLRSEGSGRNWVFLSDTISSGKYSIRPKITFTVSD
ncbi:MAG: hypothetical protein IK002_06150 [Treponema sp.]|uniref:hypothetical protein n=1 Tax=Treponema sp. TaxID=166 RepID=UPI00298DD2C9|nr:hypothetical protein [Treponema sp.]MBR5933554.1 hypothetical protein [Treponema sp.]